MSPSLLTQTKLHRLSHLRRLQEARRELEVAETRARPEWRSPGALAVAADPTFVQTPALELIDAALIELHDDPDVNRLMVFMPPQEGKSERISHRFPEWVLRFNPDARIAIVSYQDEIARRWGSEIKQDCQNFTGEDGGLDLGIQLREDSRAAGRWNVRGHRGGCYCVGISGSLTGRAVDWLIIDDPFKDLEQAMSRVYRERARRFWRAVAVPRLAPTSKVIIVQTRWHQDDLSGWLLADQPDEWKVINIPAIAEDTSEIPNAIPDALGRPPGTPMVSARGNRDWAKIRRNVGEQVWAALYQQRPAPAEGGIFKRSWWKLYDTPRWIERPDGTCWVPGADEVVTSWDMAFKDLDDSDYVCGQVWARFGLRAVLVDLVREQLDFVNTLRVVREKAARWPQSTAKYIEDKANGTAVINMLATTVSGLIPVEPDGSKLARARAISPFVEAGQVEIPAPELCSWAGAFMEEFSLFPNASNDDQVDAGSQALNRLLLNPILSTEQVIDESDIDNDDDGGHSISPY